MLSFCPSLMKIASARHATYAIVNPTDLLFCPPKKVWRPGKASKDKLRGTLSTTGGCLNATSSCLLLFPYAVVERNYINPKLTSLLVPFNQWEITAPHKKEKLQQQNSESRWQLAMSLFEETFPCVDCAHLKHSLKMTVFSAIWECQTNLTSSFTQ